MLTQATAIGRTRATELLPGLPVLTRTVVPRRTGVKSVTIYTGVTDVSYLPGPRGECASRAERSPGCEDSGIEAFADVIDARLRRAYLRMFRSPIGDGYVYLCPTVLLRLISVNTQAPALKVPFERAGRGSR
jgi:hypothetical protein